MQLKEIVSAQKKKLQTTLSPQEQALGEIIFNNGQCQVLAQSVSRFDNGIRSHLLKTVLVPPHLPFL